MCLNWNCLKSTNNFVLLTNDKKYIFFLFFVRHVLCYTFMMILCNFYITVKVHKNLSTLEKFVYYYHVLTIVFVVKSGRVLTIS